MGETLTPAKVANLIRSHIRLEWRGHDDADINPRSVTAAAEAICAASPATEAAPTPRPLSDYHEDEGYVTWWVLPVREPPWVGSPNCSDWPGYHTHWTPAPPCPAAPVEEPDWGLVYGGGTET